MKMLENDWVLIEHFTRDEAWGDWREMNRNIFLYADAMREESGLPFIVYCGYELGGHTETSQHYLGNAIDGRTSGMTLLDQYLLAERFPWVGIGVYPQWRNTKKFKTSFLHLDVRPVDKYRGARWGMLDDEYVPLDSTMLRVLAEE